MCLKVIEGIKLEWKEITVNNFARLDRKLFATNARKIIEPTAQHLHLIYL